MTELETSHHRQEGNLQMTHQYLSLSTDKASQQYLQLLF